MTTTATKPPVKCKVHGVTFIGEDDRCHHGATGPGNCTAGLIPNVPPLNEPVYELIRAPLFDCPPGQSAYAAQQKIADEVAANPFVLMNWLVDAGIVEHVVFTDIERRVTVSSKDAPPVCTDPAHRGLPRTGGPFAPLPPFTPEEAVLLRRCVAFTLASLGAHLSDGLDLSGVSLVTEPELWPLHTALAEATR